MFGNGYGYGVGPAGMMGGGGWLVGLIIIASIALLVAGAVLLVIWMRGASQHRVSPGTSSAPPAAAGHDEAVAIAKRRFASGEITKDQFDELMRALGSAS